MFEINRGTHGRRFFSKQGLAIDRNGFSCQPIEYKGPTLLDPTEQPIPMLAQFFGTKLGTFRMAIVVRMDIGVAIEAQRHSVAFVIGSAFRLRDNVMNLDLDSAELPAQTTASTGLDQQI